MRHLKFIALLAATACTISHTAFADGSRSSAIHKAAAERLQSKLGEIRGTIKPATPNVFLTEFMIEQLKPIEIVEEEDERASLESDGTDRDLITHSIEHEQDFVSLVSESDLDELTSAVDHMIKAQD